jgi:hypothetical protein
VECENDIWTSLAALIGLAAAVAGAGMLDPLAGILVGMWIVWGGYRFGRKNIDYLMGKSPGQELVERIRSMALEIAGVRGVHDVRAHYVGHRVHVEVHVEVDQELPTRRSHDVGGSVRAAIERLPGVDRAFIHVDPVPGSTLAVETLARIERAASEAYSAYARFDAVRPQVAALWTALAAAAQARADRLDVVRRLKGAGWHFADDELVAERIERRWARAREAAEVARDGGQSIDGALELALELEGREAREDFARATTPRDPTVRASLEGSSPPPPAKSAMLERVEAAARLLEGGAGSERLARLARELAGGDAPSGG